MSLRFRTKIAFASVIVLLVAGTAMPGQAAQPGTGISPALCGPTDTPEPGIQGDVPGGPGTANYNCGLTLVGQISPGGGAVQGAGQCAYQRSGSQIKVIDVSDPAAPFVHTSVPLGVVGSETMRAVVAPDRAVLVSGSHVYDISDCLNPVLAGEIKWPNVSLPGIPTRLLPHDIRVNRAATKVYASFGLWEVDITDLHNPNNWTITDHRCELAAQQDGPWSRVHAESLLAGRNLCTDQATPGGFPRFGAGYVLGASALQASLFWPQLSHGPSVNADDTRVYVGDQAGGNSALWAPVPKVRIIDVTQSPPQILGEVDGPGHSVEWFRTAKGREYVLHANEGGSAGIPGQAAGGDTCQPHPRPFTLGWGFEVFVSDVTGDEGNFDSARLESMLTLAINEPEFCDVRQASGHDPSVSQHMVDNPLNAKFAAVEFGRAGLRMFDIRDPKVPQEVAYFNRGSLVHSGVPHYDAGRGLLYVPGSTAFWVLEIQPQVRAHLGLP